MIFLSFCPPFACVFREKKRHGTTPMPNLHTRKFVCGRTFFRKKRAHPIFLRVRQSRTPPPDAETCFLQNNGQTDTSFPIPFFREAIARRIRIARTRRQNRLRTFAILPRPRFARKRPRAVGRRRGCKASPPRTFRSAARSPPCASPRRDCSPSASGKNAAAA